MDERFTEQFWDERYTSTTRVWSGNPNPQLVTETEDLDPGTALDAGCGEGADAHWLARRGWRVTATDISTVALERGAAHAEPDIADRITWLQADLLTWVPDQVYDLVNAQFMHLPRALREPAFARLAAAVAPGGTLLIVGHHLSDRDSGAHRHGDPDMFFTVEDIAAGLDPEHWTIQTGVTRPRKATDAGGNVITVHDTVLRAQRGGSWSTVENPKRA
jgi:SAM-dependent methyltransferase